MAANAQKVPILSVLVRDNLLDSPQSFLAQMEKTIVELLKNSLDNLKRSVGIALNHKSGSGRSQYPSHAFQNFVLESFDVNLDKVNMFTFREHCLDGCHRHI